MTLNIGFLQRPLWIADSIGGCNTWILILEQEVLQMKQTVERQIPEARRFGEFKQARMD